jgi:hypothetical protein
MKCKGIFGFLFGHKYQGRFSITESKRFPTRAIKVDQIFDVNDLKETDFTKTYVQDVCVRCGNIIEKSNTR